MSSLIVEISRIEQVLPHPSADRLELAHIKGWQCVIPRGKYAAGDLVTYVPIDSVLPVELSERLGVTKYLSKGRVRCARLRGEPSFGLIFDRENPADEVGVDVAERYGITRYLPPKAIVTGDAEQSHPLFVSYTEIENMRNFPAAMHDGEEVVAAEKIHGANCRVAIITDDGRKIRMGGSKSVRRKEPAPERLGDDLYWFPHSLPAVERLLQTLAEKHRQVILFGEVYGRVQSLRYGEKDLAYRAFDLMLDGRYVDYDVFALACREFGVQTAPLIYRGPFSLARIAEMAEGQSALPGADHIREGVVVRPAVERTDPRLGRVILKYVGNGYLFSGASDTTDV